MSEQSEKAYGIGRLKSKTARAAIIQKIATDFNLMPIIAEAYYKQISTYFHQHANIQLTSGQICYEAVKLVRTVTADIDKISQITHLSKRVIKQYLDLIPDDELEAMTSELEHVEERALNNQ